MDAAHSIFTPAELLRTGTARLGAAGIATARLDAEVLLALAMGTDRAGLYARLHLASSAELEQRFTTLVDRRARREPVAYITGVQEFWSLPFAVNPSVLIPRPETELLVEITVRRLQEFWSLDPGADARVNNVHICDVGTGSGCVAIALARELPSARVVALDVSADALAVAARNAAAHAVAERITFVQSDLFDALASDARFDVIVSNPPYCSPSDSAAPGLDFEPRVALAAGADGLAVVRRLVAAAPARLHAGGRLVIELGRGQDAAVRTNAAAAGFTDIDIAADLAGIPRVLVARRS